MSYDSGLDAVQTLIDYSIKNAGYPRTYQMQILSCTDQALGVYKCRYQDKTIQVHSANPQIMYPPKSMVYVLVPEDDWTKEKIIMGTVKQLGTDYISTAAGDELYNLTGTNCINDNTNLYYLDTNNKDYRYIIYKYEDPENKQNSEEESRNDNFLNTEALNEYIKQSSALLVGAVFKTNIDPKKQYRGHYGITFNLLFKTNNATSTVIRSYTVDEDNMVGNPYRLTKPTRQYQIYDIDVNNFQRLDSIEIFNKDFPNATGENTSTLISTTDENSNPDIQISQLEICGMTKMLENEINGIAISFLTPEGSYFSASNQEKPYKTITAQIKIKGKVLSTLDKVPFYWGKENMMVTPDHPKYNKFLGRGWACLNQSNIIQTVQDDKSKEPKPNIVEWIPASDTHVFYIQDATAIDNKFKVAVVYDGNVITKEINIKNLNSECNITIESDSGTEFYYDTGNPNLTCKINGEQRLDVDEKGQDIYSYYWSYQSNTGLLEDLPQWTQYQIDEYNNELIALENLQSAIIKGERFANEAADNLRDIKNAIAAYDVVQRIEKNKIYNVQINKITSFGIFKCSVYRKETYLGTASITLTNKLQNEGVYSLVIDNGDVVYQYNEEGKSPTIVEGSLVPQTINSLTFTLYNNLGQAIETESILQDTQCKVRWKVPITDTLIINDTSKNASENSFSDTNYYYYDDLQNLYYDISKNYYNRSNNQIELEVDYKGMLLTAKTNFTFVKQGDPGTNGTNFVVKIVPNSPEGATLPMYPMITYINSDNKVVIVPNFTVASGQQSFFKAELWSYGERIWKDCKASDKVTKVEWSILARPVNQNDPKGWPPTCFDIIIDNKKTVGVKPKESINTSINDYYNIIKCAITYENKIYYGTLPVIVAWVTNSNYKIGLKDNTGFRHVLYTTDGISPQYDHNPFEFYCIETFIEDENKTQTTQDLGEDFRGIQYKIKSNNESLLSTRTVINELAIAKDDDGNPIPQRLADGRVWTDKDGNIIYKKVRVDYKNQVSGVPAMKYDGETTNIAIICDYTKQSENETTPTPVGKLYVPIHFLLNKYGLANLNDWDGNNIQIDQQGGYILSPQMGAGVKNDDNTFTGVLMGQVKESADKESQIGLFGYDKGARTFFLDSQSGGALFGKNNGGRIIIDPSTDKGLIFSNNYWKNIKYYDNKGFPIKKEIIDSETGLTNPSDAKEGMLIDLSTPQIKFGNGHFSVNNTEGVVAGWKMNNQELTGGYVHLNKDGSIYSGKDKDHLHNKINSTYEGFFLSHEGLSIGNKVKITNTGQARFGQGAVDGTPNRHFIISGNNKKVYTFKANGDLNSTVNRDRSYIGYGITTTNSDTEEKPSVRNDYFIPAGDHYYNKKDKLSHPTIYLGTDGISLGSNFSVDTSGNLISKSGQVGGWTIKAGNLQSIKTSNKTQQKISINSAGVIIGGNLTSDGKYDADSHWQINSNGKVLFQSGYIGGWTINSNSLSSKGITISSDGSIFGGDGSWSISGNGNAMFKNVTTLNGRIGSGFSLSGAGFSLGGGGSAGSSLGGGSGLSMLPSGITVPGGINLNQHIRNLAVDQIDAIVGNFDDANIRKRLNYGGYSATWWPVVTSIDVTQISHKNGAISRFVVRGQRRYALTTAANPGDTTGLAF